MPQAPRQTRTPARGDEPSNVHGRHVGYRQCEYNSKERANPETTSGGGRLNSRNVAEVHRSSDIFNTGYGSRENSRGTSAGKKVYGNSMHKNESTISISMYNQADHVSPQSGGRAKGKRIMQHYPTTTSLTPLVKSPRVILDWTDEGAAASQKLAANQIDSHNPSGLKR